jgi:hypothetical protein
MLCRVALVRTNGLDKLIASTISVLRLLITANIVPARRSCHPDDGGAMLLRNVCFYKNHIPEDGILRSRRRENLKSYIALTGKALQRRGNVFPVRFERIFISQKTASFIGTAVKT